MSTLQTNAGSTASSLCPSARRLFSRVHKLPDIHRDPFDRVIIAQAIIEGLAVVTPDPLIKEYAVRVEW